MTFSVSGTGLLFLLTRMLDEDAPMIHALLAKIKGKIVVTVSPVPEKFQTCTKVSIFGEPWIEDYTDVRPLYEMFKEELVKEFKLTKR
jgi:hypothetical protein